MATPENKVLRLQYTSAQIAAAVGKSPIIKLNTDGKQTLWIWDIAEMEYKDTGVTVTGPKGDQGIQGPQGPPGVMIDVATGMFAMGVNEKGHLILAVNDGDTPPPLSIDPATGHLIYSITSNEL